METTFLRTDTKGRVRTPRERREQLLDEFEHTGTSAAAFARSVGVKYQTFVRWVQLRREQRAGDAAPIKSAQAVVPFVEAIVGAKAERSGLRVGLPGGACAEISSSSEVELIAELLCALTKRRIAEEVAC